ncbi:MFS transporter [Rhodoferax saidenbachensis]|uniref:MFS transporter n=1 Tax=Rhodoferax saidenbachensis TaxID=1484693 RepID=A0A1P8KA91_9BURK|nr:MFS transporter [Rhodoferax saidenbachensis]APW42921.1 MFS transporter [Rhodoferax saidenbachensis]
MPLSGPTTTVLKLGTAQTLAWASTYYLPAILAAPIARELGVSVATVFAAFSAGLVITGILGPRAGRAIDTLGGRPVLALSNLLFAVGLALLGLANGPLSLFAAWIVIGIGMSGGLYEAAFATLVRMYGRDSRSVITGITLLAGFASTVGWPLSTALEAWIGWRGTCFAWAGLHLLIALPLNLSLPKLAAVDAPEVDPSNDTRPEQQTVVPMKSAVLLALVFAITWFISTAMAAHLPMLLTTSGVSLGMAVTAGALIGPAQVAGRLLEFGVLRHMHPLLSARIASAMHPIGAVVLAIVGAPSAILFAIFHGAGNGILTIAKGTLPLVLFGPQGYGERQGLLMVPARLAQALAPWLFGLCVEQWGAGALWVSAAMGTVAMFALWMLSQSGTTAYKD